MPKYLWAGDQLDSATMVSRLGDSPGFHFRNPRTVAIAKTAQKTGKTGQISIKVALSNQYPKTYALVLVNDSESRFTQHGSPSRENRICDARLLEMPGALDTGMTVKDLNNLHVHASCAVRFRSSRSADYLGQESSGESIKQELVAVAPQNLDFSEMSCRYGKMNNVLKLQTKLESESRERFLDRYERRLRGV